MSTCLFCGSNVGHDRDFCNADCQESFCDGHDDLENIDFDDEEYARDLMLERQELEDFEGLEPERDDNECFFDGLTFGDW
jgi:hypothetical protein